MTGGKAKGVNRYRDILDQNEEQGEQETVESPCNSFGTDELLLDEMLGNGGANRPAHLPKRPPPGTYIEEEHENS